MIYYSSWHYAAIHMALMIPELQNVSSLTRYFNLPTSRVMSVLQFLSEHHLIEQKSTHYKIKKSVLHLEKDSPILTQHHTHWRLRAIEAIQTPKLDNLHYSGIMSLSRDDYEWVRERLARLLEEVVVRLGPSKDEKLATLCFDLFQV
jgi:predicted transcriptional regulator